MAMFGKKFWRALRGGIDYVVQDLTGIPPGAWRGSLSDGSTAVGQMQVNSGAELPEGTQPLGRVVQSAPEWVKYVGFAALGAAVIGGIRMLKRGQR